MNAQMFNLKKNVQFNLNSAVYKDYRLRISKNILLYVDSANTFFYILENLLITDMENINEKFQTEG